MDRNTVTAKASVSLLGLLPDAVLLLILKDGCDKATQQAAYQSCKDLKSFCDRNVKSFVVKLAPEVSVSEVREFSSRTLCPEAAYGIEKLSISFQSSWVANFDHTYMYLDHLVNDAFASPDTPQCRSKQLANVTSLNLQLPNASVMTSQQRQTVSRLLSQLKNLRCLRTNITQLWMSIPHLTHLACTSPITPGTLQVFAKLQPSIRRLEFVFGTPLECFQSVLYQFTALDHLGLGGGLGHTWHPLPATALTGLTQLSTLTLHHVTIQDVHVLRNLNITHLRLGTVLIPDDHQLQAPTGWPALESVEFTHTNDRWSPLRETMARSILPLPHPGFSLILPTSFYFYADAAPHHQFRYLAVLHMRSIDTLFLTGLQQDVKAALQAMGQNQVTIQTLHIAAHDPLYVDAKEIATCLAFSTVRQMHVETLRTNKPKELFRQLFQHCPMLHEVTVPGLQDSVGKRHEAPETISRAYVH